VLKREGFYAPEKIISFTTQTSQSRHRGGLATCSHRLMAPANGESKNTPTPIYKDKAHGIQERVEYLLSRMSLSERERQLACSAPENNWSARRFLYQQHCEKLVACPAKLSQKDATVEASQQVISANESIQYPTKWEACEGYSALWGGVSEDALFPRGRHNRVKFSVSPLDFHTCIITNK